MWYLSCMNQPKSYSQLSIWSPKHCQWSLVSTEPGTALAVHIPDHFWVWPLHTQTTTNCRVCQGGDTHGIKHNIWYLMALWASQDIRLPGIFILYLSILEGQQKSGHNYMNLYFKFTKKVIDEALGKNLGHQVTCPRSLWAHLRTIGNDPAL